MNKYRDKSDFEINKAVAIAIGAKPFPPERTEFTQCEIPWLENAIIVKITGVKTGPFDPCNNPADAMPIIKDNLISLEHDGIAWMVSCVRHPEISVWDGCENYNDNFYRKAMELFLLMKDAENEKV
ncbi:phage protein NinX family protein [Morganella morganii]|uniref:phage protein NinX family protein n=2 Tax=Morganella morganii TaxID=582 RepID=UPI00046A5E62|nr:phage protein NinX family protein [Morganella morganii]